MFKIGAGLMGVGTVLASVPLAGALVAPGFVRDGDTWVDLGATSDYPEGETRLAKFTLPGSNPNDGETSRTAAWVRSMSGGGFQVFAVNCAHLGCPVKWFQQSRLFMCPCHGGVYYEDGSRASGPPPRGLFEYQSKVENGRLFIAAGRLPGLQEST
ncbi:MAG: Rieske 2Fe-2S domain-containing protein [Planctomycetes bacterium]|nr:Rieske 2Fe-2S domain-containing protein [Planctomycetota bacterium]